MDSQSPSDGFALALVSDDHYEEARPRPLQLISGEDTSAVSLIEQRDLNERWEQGHPQVQLALESGDRVQKDIERVLQQADAQKPRRSQRKEQAMQHRADFKQKKQKLRRRRLLEEVAETQDRDPIQVSAFNALPHFEYLEIADAVECELPLDLTGFGSLDLAAAEPPQPAANTPAEGSALVPTRRLVAGDGLFDDWSNMTDEDIGHAVAEMLQRLSTEDSQPQAELDRLLEPQDPPSAESPNKENVPPGPSSSAHSAGGTLMLPGPTRIKWDTTDPWCPQDNRVCICVTCPLSHPHFEGPYYHDGILGDQSHKFFQGSNPPPQLWDVYERSPVQRTTPEEDEALAGFWMFHIPPFPVMPDDGWHNCDGISEEGSGHVTDKDEHMGVN